MRKFIFVTGGAVSDNSKTVTAASLGLLLASRGFKVVNKKLNPFMNLSLTNLNPQKHGELFLTEDGDCVDQSLGVYERFTGSKVKESDCITAGQIYWSVINKERMGEYYSDAVTISSHVSKEIRSFVYNADDSADVVIVEVGGTVGDTQCVHFLEAIAGVSEEKGTDNVMYIHVEHIPQLVVSEEDKVVPVKQSISYLIERGISPDSIICRTERPMEQTLIDKISILCNVDKEVIVEGLETDLVYETPLLLEKSGLSAAVLKRLVMQDFKPSLDGLKKFVTKIRKAEKEVNISLVAKYASQRSAYQSLYDGLICGAEEAGVKLSVNWVDAEEISDDNASELLKDSCGVVLADGSGSLGIDGMVNAAAFARKNNIPLLAIGQGMHMAVCEFAQNVLGLKGAQSAEISQQTAYPVVTQSDEPLLGTNRIKILRNTKSFFAYGRELFAERHRQSYVVNNAYKEHMKNAGLYFVGESDDGKCEIAEYTEHRFYVLVSFRPECNSGYSNIHPLFASFMKEASLTCDNA